ncbi:MAG: hypothetical protein HGN29_08750 [Asgard group archaeon]|nr:hypothetical protein [Asgard group archaeon]
MKIRMDFETEWGYLINPKNFQILRIKDDIPEGFFVILKQREFVIEINRTVVKNTYGFVKKNALQKLDKRKLSEYLAAACADFILKNTNLPPNVLIEGDLKYMKPANLAFSVTSYDVFHLKIDSVLLKGENPKELLESIMKERNRSLSFKKKEMRWKVEYAKSSRATCKKCNNKIEKNTLRIGEPSYYQEHLSFKWFHEDCVDLSKFDETKLSGLVEIKPHDRRRIEKKLKK